MTLTEANVSEAFLASSRLPEGWASGTMGKIADVIGGGTPATADSSNFSDSGHAWITPADLSGFEGIYISHGRRDLSDEGLRNCSARLMPPGTVLMSSRAPIGYLAIAEGTLCTNQGFKSFVCQHDIVPEYVYFWLRFIRPLLEDIGSGSTFSEISGRRAQSIPIILPPTAEQARIVPKAEELLARVYAARERLRRVPAILKRFRQAVLGAACAGRLTAEWRAREGLLEWSYTPLSGRKVSIRTGPFGSALHRSDYVDGGVPLVNPTHIRDGIIKVSADCAVRAEKARELAAYRLELGDIVLGRRGEMGRAAVVRAEVAGYLCGTGSMIVRTDEYDLRPGFLCLLFRSPQTVAVLEATSVGSTMTNLNQGIVGSLDVPHVSLKEQDEIVRRVEALIGLADAIERRVATATARADRLTQSILAKAFRGELVPTEAELARRESRDYEPAAELLDRVRRQNESISAVGRRRR